VTHQALKTDRERERGRQK